MLKIVFAIALAAAGAYVTARSSAPGYNSEPVCPYPPCPKG